MQRQLSSLLLKDPLFMLRSTSVRLYQSENGVFGYKPKVKKSFSIPESVLLARQEQSNFVRWIDAFRANAHRVALINPVEFMPVERNIPELEASRYGLTDYQQVDTEGILNINQKQATISELKSILNDIYCGSISAEFSHCDTEHEREFLASNIEQLRKDSISDTTRKEIATLLLKSQTWDVFLAKKFPTVKRYGGEGAETIFAFFRELMHVSVRDGLDHIVVGMPHRGRLNLLAIMMGTPPAKIFNKFKGFSEFPAGAKGMADIATHFDVAEELNVEGKPLRISLLHNPSHLEAVNAVAMGKARSKQQSLRDGAFGHDAGKPFASSVLSVILHGDAAFAGQGINQECLIMAGTPHFDVGGSIHLIVNNQVGFTTPGSRGRATRYSSDLAKSIGAPILHVNGDDPEALLLATQLAFNYQREFRKDVFIDLNCFRRWGHNELDDPTFTNPAQYSVIHARKSIPDVYAEKLVEKNIISLGDIELINSSYWDQLNAQLIASDSFQPKVEKFQRQWSSLKQAGNEITTWDTGLDYQLLWFIGEQSIKYNTDFNIHPHLLKTHVNARKKRLAEATKIDWATAEALAIGSLMYQGNSVRLSGEDVGRGTFSHRHAMLVDQKTNEIIIPLNALKGGHGGQLEIANSVLSEEAVLGFEYGMAIDNPNNLIIWESQFGDFFNGAQIIFDTFIASGESKWLQSNGMVILLPHGYDGAASEHSSCRIERFLQLTDSNETSPDGDDINMQVINPTTPAQYFHALRRQMVRNFRKPLIVVAPKTLLRLSAATSSQKEFEAGTYFKAVIGDESVTDSKQVTKIILCSGKHYYNLDEYRKTKNRSDCAIIRVESLCPFPVNEINQELEKFKNVTSVVWSQEEHRNMGAWSFVKPRFENMCGKKIKYCGRYEGSTTAIGISSEHKKEAQDVIEQPFK